MKAETKKPTPITVFLADDHAVVRDGLRALLEAHADLRVVGDVGNGRAAVREAGTLRPDVVVIDIAMPELNGIDAAAQIRASSPATQVVILSVHADSEHIFRAFKAGALGYVMKEATGQEVVQAVRDVHTGRRYVSPRIADTVAADFVRMRHDAPERGPLERLSAREREVLQLVAEGKSSAEIAARLLLSVKTVETYRSRLMEKLDIHDLSGLIRFAILHGLTPG
jgi:DNA-binding NarL/FixJ family response regulator